MNEGRSEGDLGQKDEEKNSTKKFLGQNSRKPSEVFSRRSLLLLNKRPPNALPLNLVADQGVEVTQWPKIVGKSSAVDLRNSVSEIYKYKRECSHFSKNSCPPLRYRSQ